MGLLVTAFVMIHLLSLTSARQVSYAMAACGIVYKGNSHTGTVFME